MALIEVEYVKGGKRKKMKEVYVTPLVKLGVVRRVSQPAESVKQLRVPAYSPAAPIITREIEAEHDTDEEGKPKRKRTYKRRDLLAEGDEQ